MFYLILSFVTLVGSYFLLPTINPIIVEYRQIAEYALLAFIGISMLICIKFNRSRAFFQIFLLLIFLLSNKYYFNFTPKNLTDNAQLILLSLIFPINVVLFSFFKERGCFTIYGFFKFVFIASQVATFYWAINHQANWILQTSKISFIPNIGINFPFSDIIILNMLIGLLLLAIVFYRKRNALDVMILSLFICFIFNLSHIHQATSLIISAFVAITLLIIGILQDSFNMAYIDELTELPGRRALNEKLLMLGRHYTIAMLDVDHFKKFNDTYGHDVGDQVLQMVGMLMKKITGGGKVFRYGGEEFTVIFAGKHIHETKPHLEVLREAIANYQLVLRDQHRPVKKQPKSKKKSLNKTQQQTVSVAISIGVAERNEQHKTPEEVIKQADNALYRAKKNGRNCLSE